MNKILLNAALALVARLPWDDILTVLKAVATRRVNTLVLAQIDSLVERADALDAKGTDKKAWVVTQILGAGSPVRLMASAVPGYALSWAIDTAVLRMRAAGS